MKAIAAVVGGVGLSLMLAAPSYAQQTTTGTTTPGMVSTTGQASSSAPNGSLEKYHGEWRASKLVGANVYNQAGQSIGSVDDLLIGGDGKISNAIVSVGGFLGIGGKLVSVPFDEFKFEESRGSMGSNAVTTPATATTTTPNTGALATHATDNTSDRTVYYSIVLPNATKDSLSSAAGFKYEG